MVVLAKLTDGEVQAIARDVFGRELQGIDYNKIDVASGVDQSGDQALFVTLNMRDGAPIISGRQVANAHVALLGDVAAGGDERFVYLNVDWPGDEIPPSSDIPT